MSSAIPNSNHSDSTFQFRPCIDIGNGCVTQIIGSTLTDTVGCTSTSADTNFTTTIPSSYYAEMYAKDGLTGGHVIMLGDPTANSDAAIKALQAYPQGLQIGGGITSSNAHTYLDHGASHIIVTSYVFSNGTINMERLQELVTQVGKHKLVLDLSCRRKQGSSDSSYYVVTDRWQKYTNFILNAENILLLSQYCDEYLVHGVDVEGKKQGIEEELVKCLGEWSPIPVTYAGGVRSLEDLELVFRLGRGRVNVSVGSALDIFGGHLSYKHVVSYCKQLAQDGKATLPITETTTTTTTPTTTTTTTSTTKAATLEDRATLTSTTTLS